VTDAAAGPTPARYWRQVVRGGMPRVTGDDEEFRSYLETNLPRAMDLERFLLAVALLTYGVLEVDGIDVLDAILDNMPSVGHPARTLARAVDNLLPTGGNVLADPALTHLWLNRYRHELVWDEVAGTFNRVA
jgi:hypothetical protein